VLRMTTKKRNGTVNLELNFNFEGGLERPKDVSSLLSRENEVMSMCVSIKQIYPDLLLSPTGT